MSKFEDNDYQFPDEAEEKSNEKAAKNEFEYEIEDDTPTEDRGKTPLPRPLVEELEKDELDSYDDAVKTKLKQMRKVWHDERREKEAAVREQQETFTVAQRLLEENKRIKHMLTTGEKEYVTTVQNAAAMELEMAKRAYKEAYDAGDTDKVIDAQQAMQNANIRIMQAKNFRLPSLQDEQFAVQPQQRYQEPAPRPDNRAEDWQDQNRWFGKNKGMTAFALGLHDELKENGVPIGSNEYYTALDKTMRKRFPEAFEGGEEQSNRTESTRSKPSTVVAPAVRSTASNKVKLKVSQINLAKKLGLTPEQYVREVLKLEARNG
jgi:hypothetical protein